MTASEALDAYLDFLDSSTTTTEKEAQPTPHIDHILHNYQHHNHHQGEKRGVSEDKGRETGVAVEGGNYEGQLYLLEKQLTDLLQRSRTGGSHIKLPGRTSDSDENSESHENSPPPPPPLPLSAPPSMTVAHRQPSSSSKTRQLHPISTGQRRSTQNTSRHTSSSTRRPSPGTRDRGQRSRRVALREGQSVAVSSSAAAAAVVVSSAGEDERRRRKLLMETRQQQHQQHQQQLQQGSTGAMKKESSSMKVLNNELDLERERRWKAEQAAARLVEHVRNLQNQLSENQRQYEQCVVREARLEQELREKGKRLETMQGQMDELQSVSESRQIEVEDMKTTESKHLEMLHKLEESCRALECERLRERTELCSRLHNSEVSAAGHQREIETLRRSGKELKRQVHDLQELLANREREHIKEMERSKPLTDQQVDERIRKEVERECSKLELMLEQQKQLLRDKEKAYLELEEEFRQALRIEASRYHELQAAHQEVMGEVESSRETAVAAVKKEQKATALVAELTAMIKEQKTRISELNRSKQETMASLKEQVGELESAVSTKSKLEVRVQVLQEENSRLSAQCSAQESVIEGLREERKLWGKELAHQGAALAQDRGRMEAQLDTLTKECRVLQEQLGRERDAVRIKEKQVEDQLETIHRLKQEMAAKEHKLQSGKLEWEREQQSLQLLLEQEEASNNELQEQVSGLMERKEQLKEELGNAQEQLQHWKEKHSKLKSQWDEKLELLSRLEQSMADVQASFKEKEALLVKERDQALEISRSCEQQLKSCDDVFRCQLEAKQKAHDSHVTKVAAEKDKEIAQANQRVLVVEEEMRELLKEVAAERRSMETKLQKLSLAFQEIHA